MQEVTESDEPKEGVGISETQAKGSMQLKLRSLRWGAAAGTGVSKLQVVPHGLGPRELRGSASQLTLGSLQVGKAEQASAANCRKALPCQEETG